MKKSVIYINKIHLTEDYIQKKHGLLNSLTFASAEYISKVIKKYDLGRSKRFDNSKLSLLQRTVIHKNPHLDEYFAELLFRAILPFNMKDIELVEHTLMSSEKDTLAKVIWPNSVVFGFKQHERGGANALEFFDEHERDGSRDSFSCSQIFVDRYMIAPLPNSIQWVLDEVNQIDSTGGAHSYNLANLIKKVHDITYIVGYNDIEGDYIKKYLTENWKRAIVSACLTAMIYTYENKLLSYSVLKNEAEKLESFTNSSLEHFMSNTLMSTYYEGFYKLKGKIKRNFDQGNKTLLKTKGWDTVNGTIEQNLILHKLSYALDRCWGHDIANFIMMHLWQAEFQFQMAFTKMEEEIRKLDYPSEETITTFGTIQIIEVDNSSIIPVQKKSDRIKKNFKIGQPLRILYGTMTHPEYPNLATVLKMIVNSKYHGFGLILIKDKTVSTTMVSNGTTVPYTFWESLSTSIQRVEPDQWFQLSSEGSYVDFILNRTKSHQEHLPTEKINLDFLKNHILNYSNKHSSKA